MIVKEVYCVICSYPEWCCICPNGEVIHTTTALGQGQDKERIKEMGKMICSNVECGYCYLAPEDYEDYELVCPRCKTGTMHWVRLKRNCPSCQ